MKSDIHITEPGVNIAGLDPISRFKRCLEHVSDHYSDASHLFLMGDLTHHGLYEEYNLQLGAFFLLQEKLSTDTPDALTGAGVAQG